MRIHLITIICFFSIQVLGGSSINYENKALAKILKKNGINDFSLLKEIVLDDSIKTLYNFQGKYFLINSDVSKFKYIYTGRVNSCRAGGCSNPVDVPQKGQSEYFDYFILFDKDKTVQLVKVFNYQASHGHEITAKGWLKQFIGFNGSEPLQVDKDIDAISGATISVYAITFDVDIKTELLQKHL
jgi:Na+-translocating ferredoxin:NAD+ oxidoreductase RnfG subunit